MTKADRKSLAAKCRAMFEQGCDTVEMAKSTCTTEHDCERALHLALERRRSVLGSLGTRAG